MVAPFGRSAFQPVSTALRALSALQLSSAQALADLLKAAEGGVLKC
jgi:hypothetical protein